MEEPLLNFSRLPLPASLSGAATALAVHGRGPFVFVGSALRDMDADELDDAVTELLLEEDAVPRAEMVSDGDADIDRSVCVADPWNKFAEMVSVTVAGMNSVILAYGDCDSIDERVLLAEAHGDDE